MKKKNQNISLELVDFATDKTDRFRGNTTLYRAKKMLIEEAYYLVKEKFNTGVFRIGKLFFLCMLIKNYAFAQNPDSLFHKEIEVVYNNVDSNELDYITLRCFYEKNNYMYAKEGEYFYNFNGGVFGCEGENNNKNNKGDMFKITPFYRGFYMEYDSVHYIWESTFLQNPSKGYYNGRRALNIYSNCNRSLIYATYFPFYKLDTTIRGWQPARDERPNGDQILEARHYYKKSINDSLHLFVSYEPNGVPIDSLYLKFKFIHTIEDFLKLLQARGLYDEIEPFLKEKDKLKPITVEKAKPTEKIIVKPPKKFKRK